MSSDTSSDNGAGSPETASTIRERKQRAVEVSSAAADLERIQRAHEWDPNMPQEKMDAVKTAMVDRDADEILAADELFTEDSPYPEVRAAVRNTDGEEPANTVRAWILGMVFVTIGSGLNMFLSLR